MDQYRQNQVDLAAGNDTAGEAVRLLQVLNSRAQEAQHSTSRMYEMATVMSFSDYADGFRRVQEFLSFCDVIESKLDGIPAVTREPILYEVTAVKIRAFHALLRGMGAYLTALERRGMINFFAQAVFLMQQEVIIGFRDHTLPNLPPKQVPQQMKELIDEIPQRLKRLLDRCIDVPDFRFAP